MDFFTNGNGQVFFRWCVGGFVTVGGIVIPAQIGAGNIWLELGVKLCFATVGAGVSGFVAVLAKDFYKHKIEKRLFKDRPENDDEEDDSLTP
jgi:hypothetical protein